MAEAAAPRTARSIPETDPQRPWLREQLLARRRRLEALVLPAARAAAQDLLREVDSALSRLEGGSFGICEHCQETVEDERLLANPLVRVCLGCLSESQARALERDLEAAAAVQAALLPKRRIETDGWQIAYHYRPRGSVSGDHCDVVLGSEGSPTLFLLGDVSGKGVAASLLMAHLQAVFRSLSPLGLELADLVSRANHLLCESTSASSFATLVIGRLWASGALEVCNAGHSTPIVLCSGAPLRLPATGLPLGMFGESRYEVRRLDMAGGDLLFLYSDGLSEAADTAGEAFGVGRIEAALGETRLRSPAAVLEHCLEKLEAFRETAEITDDLTRMAVRRAG